jgi:hypothetical protein
MKKNWNGRKSAQRTQKGIAVPQRFGDVPSLFCTLLRPINSLEK